MLKASGEKDRNDKKFLDYVENLFKMVGFSCYEKHDLEREKGR